ncbi:hypothetical protein BN1723_005538, partial [Verticillium longisporum]
QTTPDHQLSPRNKPCPPSSLYPPPEDLRAREENNEKMAYLMHVIGYDTATAKSLAKPRRDRSPSRTRA